MPSSPSAQEVNPLQAAVEAMRGTPGCKDSGEVSHFPELCRVCLGLKARAALPHLLRAAVEGMESVAPEAPGEVEIAGRFIPRAALLSALTDAAERVTK